jgi:hypothetical protein
MIQSSADSIANFQKSVTATDQLASQLQPIKKMEANLKPAPGRTEAQVQQIMANGITPELAEEMFVSDVSRNENEVRAVLAAAGVKKIPQGAFDGLVSMQNQLGNISYVYVNGEKIDLTNLYRQGNWQRVASFVAADERDRPRRIREANMIAKGDYGPAPNPSAIIKKGFDDAKEKLAKEQLNKQTGNPATDQQKVALANSYFATNQTALPDASTALKLASAKNYAEEYITKRYKRQLGPWPY